MSCDALLAIISVPRLVFSLVTGKTFFGITKRAVSFVVLDI